MREAFQFKIENFDKKYFSSLDITVGCLTVYRKTNIKYLAYILPYTSSPLKLVKSL